jgi:hypothetical protein
VKYTERSVSSATSTEANKIFHDISLARKQNKRNVLSLLSHFATTEKAEDTTVEPMRITRGYDAEITWRRAIDD